MTTPDDQPVPQGNYRAAVRHADVIRTSGMTPRKNGELLYSGKILAGDPPAIHRPAVELATINALAAARSCLTPGEEIAAILQLTVFLNTGPGFARHSAVADYASDILMKTLGPSAIGSRAAVGVASLPGGAPVEVTLVAAARTTERE